MEQENVQVVDETIKTTESVEPQTTEKNESKTFTQEEVEDMIKTRLRNMPSKEELEAFKSWKESQKTPDEVQEELNQKITTLETNYSSLEQQNMILKSGITDADDIDYIQYKVSKMDGDFNDNLKDFLKDNPKFKKEEIKQTGFSQNNTIKPISENKAYLDKKYANNPYYKK